MLSSFSGSFSFGKRVSGLVSSNLTLHIDAGNPSSYSGSGSTWTDIAGTADNITLVGSPSYTSGTPAYFTFNGSSQYGTGSASDILPSTEYTKFIWFYLNAYSDNNLLSSTSGGHFMFFGSSTSTMYCGHTNWTSLGYTFISYPSNATFNLNTWYNAALTFSTTNGMTLYINGVQDSTFTGTKAAHGGNGSTNIATFGGGNLLNGRISQALCYNRELTASEILQNYNSTKSKFGL